MMEGAISVAHTFHAAPTSTTQLPTIVCKFKIQTHSNAIQKNQQVRDYLAQLESHLSEAARQASRLVSKEAELTDALADFGRSVEGLARLEGGGAAEALARLAAKAGAVAEARRGQVAQLAARFEAPIKEVRALCAFCALFCTPFACL